MAINIHGKPYKMVAERISEAHKDHGNKITILTKIVNKDWLTAGVIVMKATVKIEDDVNRNEFTGHAYEQLGSSQINQTSALENCETSAIGRALACAGYIGSEFASADELANALNQQQEQPVREQQSDSKYPSKVPSSTNQQQPYSSHKKGDLIGQWDSYDDNVNFGKHRNEPWTEVPEDYLRWIIEKATKVPEGSKEMARGMLDIREVTPITPVVSQKTTTPSTTKTAQPKNTPIKGVKKGSGKSAQEAIDNLVDKYAGELDDDKHEQSDLPF